MELLFLILLGAGKAVSHAAVSKRYLKNNTDRYLFNVLLFAVSLLIVLFGSSVNALTVPAILLGILFGVMSIVYQTTYSVALKSGPVSITVLINSFSLALPTIAGFVFWNEKADMVQLLGLALLIFSFFLSVGPLASGGMNFKWLLYVVLVFFTSGSLAIIQKIYRSCEPRGTLNIFLVFAFAVAMLISGPMYFVNKRKERASFRLSLKALAAIILCGILFGCFQFLSLDLAGKINSSVLYPVSSGGTTIVSTIASSLIFRDKLSSRQWLGTVLGLIAVLMISC